MGSAERTFRFRDDNTYRIIRHKRATNSDQDLTYPKFGKQYISGQTIINNILSHKLNDINDLNGLILLMHIGTDERRTDKLYNRLDESITELKRRDYSFTLLSESI